MNTHNILFICGGAFEGIEKHIARRMNTHVIGFKADGKKTIDRENLVAYVNQQDLKHFGLIPELVGRLPVVTHLEQLDLETLQRILVEPKNALLKQYTKLFALEGIRLTFTNEAIEYIAQKALDYKLGARGLRSICEAVMNDAMYELPSQKDIKEFKVTESYAIEKMDGSKLSLLKAA